MRKKLIFSFVLALCFVCISNCFASAKTNSHTCGFEEDAYIYLDTVKIIDIARVRFVEVGNYASGVECVAYKTKAFFSNGMYYSEFMPNDNADNINPKEHPYLYYAKKNDLVIVKIKATSRYREIVELVENISAE